MTALPGTVSTPLVGIPAPVEALAAHSDAIAWAVVVAFLACAALEVAGRPDLAVPVGAGAWGLFGAFWLSVFPGFAFEMRSPIEGVLSLLAVPACLYAGYLLLSGRESLLVLSRAVALMGVIYLPVETVPFVRQFLIETVAAQTEAVMGAAGYHPRVGAGPEYGYRNAFTFVGADGTEYATYIITACTGIGSIAIFGGLVAAVRAPLRRRARALAVAVGVIWVLNVARNAFIAVAYGRQWFRQDAVVGFVTAHVHPDPGYASYFVADRVIAQSLAVVALVGITWLVVREVPEVLAVLEEALFVLTRREWDLGWALGVEEGGGRPAAETAGGADGAGDPPGPTGDPETGVRTDGGGD